LTISCDPDVVCWLELHPSSNARTITPANSNGASDTNCFSDCFMPTSD
jgi:hypothetical protein